MNEQTAPRYLFLSGFWLKVLAFLFMTIDHLGVFLSRIPGTYEVAGAFRIIGRLAFPLFVFLLAEGMRLSHRKGRYVLRILIAYLIITIPETILVYIPALADLAQVSPTTLEAHPFTDILFFFRSNLKRRTCFRFVHGCFVLIILLWIWFLLWGSVFGQKHIRGNSVGKRRYRLCVDN